MFDSFELSYRKYLHDDVTVHYTTMLNDYFSNTVTLT